LGHPVAYTAISEANNMQQNNKLNQGNFAFNRVCDENGIDSIFLVNSEYIVR